MDYPFGSLVWARIGANWWPGTVTNAENCPQEFMKGLKKDPLLIVKFFNEQDFFDIQKQDTVLPYNCSRKDDLIRKGLNSLRNNASLLVKYEQDILKAEKLSGGNGNIINEMRDNRKRKIDYTDMGFGIPKPRKAPKDESMQKQGFSNIGKAVQYKKASNSNSRKQTIQHEVRILEQPKPDGDMKTDSSWFKCNVCGFTCVRLNVIIWHNKTHLNKVADYDSGIRIPGKRKRKQQTPRSRSSKSKPKANVVNDSSATNGHTPSANTQGAKDLLLDWEDDEEEEVSTAVPSKEGPSNGIGDSDDEGPLPPATKERQPMPDQKDINSAFDALLAESGDTPVTTNSTDNYANNDSDSDCSDWEKYYDNTEYRSLSPKSNSSVHVNGNENEENGETSQVLEEDEAKTDSNNLEEEPSSNSIEKLSSEELNIPKPPSPIEKESSPTQMDDSEETINVPKTESQQCSNDEKPSNPSPPVSPISKSGDVSLPTKTTEKVTPSTGASSSGPAYMLVAVDAQGNNVPMPVLSEGGNNLVAVEASMEDGTTRTLYIDPAHLGPNVDLNNLMLHIDNSGEETVYIAPASTEGEPKESKATESLSN